MWQFRAVHAWCLYRSHLHSSGKQFRKLPPHQTRSELMKNAWRWHLNLREFRILRHTSFSHFQTCAWNKHSKVSAILYGEVKILSTSFERPYKKILNALVSFEICHSQLKLWAVKERAPKWQKSFCTNSGEFTLEYSYHAFHMHDFTQCG